MSDDVTDPTEAKGPSYRDEIMPLVEGLAKLLLRVRELRPDAPVGTEPPCVFVDAVALRLRVVIPLADGRFIVLDDLSIDPTRPDFGVSTVPLMPGGQLHRTH